MHPLGIDGAALESYTLVNGATIRIRRKDYPLSGSQNTFLPLRSVVRTLTRQLSAAIIVLVWCTCLGSCATVSYYRQALAGQIKVVQRQEPIDELLRENEVDPRLGDKLQLVLELRDFASAELALPCGRNYENYADLGREHVLWSIFAAPEFSLEPKTWFYPVVGSLDYRGFFKEDDARRYADRIRSKGFDVFVADVDAYSTLGWFPDPVLNTFIDYEEVDIAEIIFHELTHRRVYRSGETAFNEAMATAVAQEGVVRWLRSSGRRDALRIYQFRLDRAAMVYSEIAMTRKSLEVLFARPISPHEMRTGKRALLQKLQKRLEVLFSNWDGRAPESWLKNLPNNARLNATATYYEHVPLFEAFLHRECDGNLPQFFRTMERVDVSAFLTP